MELDAKFTVLVTGSSGHLGTALMLHLPSLGLNPLGIDIIASPTTHHTGSISDRAFISAVLSSNPSIEHILHAATLHKPHVDSHPPQAFIDTNITGTQILLEEAANLPDLQSFLFISTTSAFGDALSPAKGEPAAWIDELTIPKPKNIYGVTKCAAEDLCLLAQKKNSFSIIILRTSRFFPEEDDDPGSRNSLPDDNLKILELAHRRCDIADIVGACFAAMTHSQHIRGQRFIISGPTPFANDPSTLRLLVDSPGEAYIKAVPETEAVFREKGWAFLSRVDRVYDSGKALRELPWLPQYTFERALKKVAKGEEWRSDLSLKVGKRGYHAVTTGVYTTR